MSQLQLLKRVLSVLDRFEIEYMVTGSYASSFYGEPRTTHDLDLVVKMAPDHLVPLRREFPPPEYYLDENAAGDAIGSAGMFNLISTSEGDKVDFWMLTDLPWDRSRFGRRRVEKALGMELRMPAPEDVILAKLRWCKLSGVSEKQMRDATAVYEIQGSTLDVPYIERWANELGVSDLWDRVVSTGQIL